MVNPSVALDSQDSCQCLCHVDERQTPPLAVALEVPRGRSEIRTPAVWVQTRRLTTRLIARSSVMGLTGRITHLIRWLLPQRQVGPLLRLDPTKTLPSKDPIHRSGVGTRTRISSL